MSTQLRRALEQVARRFRHARLWTGLTLCWLIWALAGVVQVGAVWLVIATSWASSSRLSVTWFRPWWTVTPSWRRSAIVGVLKLPPMMVRLVIGYLCCLVVAH